MLPSNRWPAAALHTGRRVGRYASSRIATSPPLPRERAFRRADNSLLWSKLREGAKSPSKLKRRKGQPLGEVELVFLGTSSAAPTTSRNQQSVAFLLGGETWLFDCGETTQLQMVRAGIPPLSTTRIFISHMHGDHVFGLPSVIAAIGAAAMAQVASTMEVRHWEKVGADDVHLLES